MFLLSLLLAALLMLKSTEKEENLGSEVRNQVKEYLRPFGEITREMMDNTIRHAFSKHNSRNTTVLFQYIDGRLRCDTSKFHSQHLWDQQRLQFINDTLHALVTYRHFERDFELVYNPHDCPVRKLFHQLEGLPPLAPIFGNLKCSRGHEAIIPFPQWYYRRDGSFANMSWHVNNDWTRTWRDRRPTAVFRGFQRTSCLTPNLHFLNSTEHLQCGRSALADKSLFKKSGAISDLVDIILLNSTSTHGSMSLEEQGRIFKYVIYAEGNCGWADRLKLLLTSGMLILLQDTACQEWYHHLLRPWKHYVPVRNDWSDLLERIQWARSNDNAAQKIVHNAFAFGMQLMNSTLWEDYLYELVFEYSQRQTYKIPFRQHFV